MSTFQERLIAERNELYERHQKLAAFLSSAKFIMLTTEERALLKAQESLMGAYFIILTRRVCITHEKAAQAAAAESARKSAAFDSLPDDFEAPH